MGLYDKYIDEVAPSTTPTPAEPAAPQSAPASPFDKYVDEATSSDKLSASLFEANGTNPDAESKKLQASKTLGIPPAILPQDVSIMLNTKLNDAERIKTESPKTAKFLENPDNAKVTGHEGIRGLESIERIHAMLPEYATKKKLEREWGDVAPDLAKSLAAGTNIMLAGTGEMGRYLPATRLINEAVKAISGVDTIDASQDVLNENVTYWQGQKSEALKQTLNDFNKADLVDSVKMLATNPALLSDQLIQSAPYLIPGSQVAKAGGAAMLTYNALQEAMDAANSARQEAKAAGASLDDQNTAAGTAALITAPLAFLGNKLAGTGLIEAGFLTKGTTGHNLLSTAIREMISGAAEEGGNTFGMNVGARITYDPTRDITQGVAKSAAVGGLLEATHAVGMSSTELALRTFVKDSQAAIDASIKETDSAKQAENLHGVMSDLTAQVQENALVKRNPEAFHEFVTTMTEDGDLSEVYVKGKTLAAALDSAGVTLEAFHKILPEVARDLQTAIAVDTTGVANTVRIPVADYLTYIATTKAGEILLPELQKTPDGKTYAEAQALYQTQQEEFAKQATTIAEQNAEVLSRAEFERQKTAEELKAQTDKLAAVADEVVAALDGTEAPVTSDNPAPTATPQAQPATTLEAPQASPLPNTKLPATYEEYLAQHTNQREAYAKDVQYVEDTLKEQFKNTGRFTQSVNAAYTTPLVEAYKTQAKRMGMTPSALYAKFPFKVQSFLSGTRSTNLDQRAQATLEDFSPANVKDILDKTGWAMLTAANPMGEAHSDEFNAERMDALRNDLRALGVQFTEAEGHYGAPEPSIVAVGITPEQALNLGRKYNQDSVLTPEGLIYQDGSRTPATGTVDVFATPPEDFFTKVAAPNGEAATFSIGLDFDTRLQPGEVYVNPEAIGDGTDQTETEAFKKWFGDSKVVDENGKPLVVYHSTTFGSFDTFDKAAQRKGMAGYGFYFTDKEGSNIYADYGLNFQAEQDWLGNEKKVNVMPVYVSINNPLVANSIAEVKAVYGRQDPGSFGVGRKYGGMSSDEKTAIQRAGYDGVITKEYVLRKRNGSYDVVEKGTKGAIEHPVYVAFEPTQIKSAIGNQGTFDATNPNILKQEGGKVGQVAIVGVHYSNQKRQFLTGATHGTGAKGAEAERLRGSTDSRIKHRIYFYVDEGKGVFPEYGVGNVPHTVTLTNMYDGARNPQRFPSRNAQGERDMNLFESAVIDAGFDGYYVEGGFGRQGVAVMLGDATRTVHEDKPLYQTSEQVVHRTRKFGEEIVTAFKDIAQAEGTIKFPKVNADSFEATLMGLHPSTKELEISAPRQIGKGRTRIAALNRVTGHTAYLIDNGKGEIWVDLSELKSKKDLGSAFYAAAADYAFYNNKVFIGDPAGLSDVALFRRTENMLSIALKYGTTKHIAPHLKQTDPYLFADQYGSGKFAEDVQPLRWKEGDDDFNIASLAITAYNNLLKLFPEIADATWNSETGNFEWSDGRPFDADAVAKHATVRALKENGYGDLVSRTQNVDGGTSESSPIGGRTLRRGIITQTILRGQSAEERGVILAALSNRVRRPGVSAGVDQDFSELLYQSPREKWYFSTLAASIASAKQEAMPATQWKAWLTSNAPKLGIKQAEIQWTGINEWLDLQEGKVTKAAITEYLDANGVQVEETVLGEGDYAVYDGDSNQYFANRAEAENYAREQGININEDTVFRASNRTGGYGSKYSSYMPEGGENYKEVLLTLPEGASQTELDAVAERIYKKPYAGLDDYQKRAVRKDYGLNKGNYKSPHFDQANILAHTRIDERTDTDGKKVMFVGEIQSDWGQEGKRKGFAEPIEAVYEGKNNAGLETWKIGEGRIWKSDSEKYGTYEVRQSGKLAGFSSLEEAIEWAQKNNVDTRIPNAPFVTDTKSWVGLAMKRMIAYAVENGFDKVAFINGQQAADLYDLSKQIDRVEYTLNVDGTADVEAISLDEFTPVVSKGNQTQEQVADILGKDIAQSIFDDQGIEDESFGEGVKAIVGDGLKVGGEGMRAFYDKIVPQVANDVLKKIGGGKVETVNLPSKKSKGSLTESVYGMDAVYSQLPPESKAKIDEMYANRTQQQIGFTITPEMKAQVAQGLPLFQQQLGSFNVDTLTTTLLAGANFSTVIHESGHFYLKMLQEFASYPNATEQMVSDYEKALNWFGVTRGAWESMTLDQQRPYHEQWAESFERWHFEGKAPTLQMQPLFARFRAWMVSVYKSLEDFLQQHPAAGKLNDEVRGIFGRLIASEEAIAATEKARGYQPLFTSAEEAGVSQTAFDEYLAIGRQATQNGVDELQARSMRDMKWVSNARSAALKDLQAIANAQRKAIRTEVTAEVMAEPVNQARQFLKDGEFKDPTSGDTVKLTEGYKIDKAALKEMYPEGALDTPDLAALRGMTSDKGLHPDMLAPMFGFDSGDALVRTLLTEEKAADKIDGLVDQRMLEEHGELVDPRSIQRAADEAIHNEARAKFMATGLKMLAKSQVSATQMVKAAKQAADNAIAQKKVRDIKPNQYLAAETKANKNVLKLVAKDPAAAAEAQRAALLNNRLAVAAQDAVTEVEKALKYLGKFNNESTRKSIGLEHIEQIDALLAPFDLRKGLSLTTIDARATLADWIAQQEALGFEPTIDPEEMAAAKQKSYKNMTMVEVRGLLDTVKQIEHIGRLNQKLLTAQDKADFAVRIAEAKASIAMNAGKRVKEHATPTDAVGMFGRWVRQMSAAHRKFASFMRELDGGKDNGVMFNLLMKPATDAANIETEMRGQATEAMAELFAPIAKELSKDYVAGNVYAKKRVVPGTDISMTHEQRLMFGMNWGNEGNRQRLLDGGLTGKKALSPAEARAILDTLTKQEWDFIQGTWDYISSYKPQIEALERQLTGKTPEWIEPSPVETKYGTYAGGYFPAKYDRMLSTRSDAYEALADLRQAMKGTFGSSVTRNGYAKARADAVVGRPILLSFSTIQAHLNEVIHRTAWQPWLIDAGRIIRALDEDLRLHLGAEALAEISSVKDDITSGEAPAKGPWEVFINRVRTGSTIVGLGWKLGTAVLQLFGVSNSFAQVSPRHMAKGLAQFYASPIDSAAWVESHSLFMKNRAKTMNRNINEIMNTIRAGEKMSAVEGSFFYLIGKFQRTVDVPTYLAGYEQSLEQQHYELAATEEERKAIEKQAHAVAEQTVKNTQGAGETIDLAGIQRGSPLMKLFTNFYSYMNTVYNMNVNAFRGTHFNSPSEVGIFAADMVLINFVPAMLSLLLRNALKGACEWDDPECLADNYAREQVGYITGQMVGLREMTTAVEAVAGTKTYGYEGPAGMRFFADVTKLGQQLGQGEADLPLFKVANSVGGALLHYPAGQINNTVDGLVAIQNGEVEGWGVLQALISGAPK